MPIANDVLMQRFKAFIFTMVWIGCLIGLVHSIKDTRAFLNAAVEVPGRVVALNAGGSHPQIEFITRQGQRISYPQGGWIFGYRVGDKVRVLYLADAPNPRATIDQTGAIWSSTIFLLVMVIGLPSIAVAMVLSRKFAGSKDRSRWKITD